jgi:Natural resistance-associated macrophage protein
VLSLNHSLHRPVTTAKGFYACYAGLMAIAAALVLTPGVPLGLLTEGVQTLAGVLLPSAAVFLLLLCNDKAVLGPWANSKKLNIFTAAVIWVLILLSIILTASVLFPNITGTQIEGVLGGGVTLGVLVGLYLLVHAHRNGRGTTVEDVLAESSRDTWRMPALASLVKPVMSTQRKIGLMTLRGYLLIAFALVVVRIVQVAVGS